MSPASRTRLWERLLVTVMALAAGVAVCVVVAAARDVPGGVSREHKAMNSLGGTGQTFDTIAWCLARLPALAALTFVVLLMLLVVRSLRRRAAAALVLFVCANVSAQALKDVLARALRPAAATMPSGHAVLALTVACAIVLVAPARWRSGALVGAGALATLGCLGTIAAYWHVPGDVIAALALVAAWLVVVQVWFWPSDSSGLPENRRIAGAALAATFAGAGWCVVTFLGWGTVLNDFTAARRAAGAFDLLVVPSAAAALVAMSTRCLPEVPPEKH